MARDHFLEWGRAPHNPYEGKDRPAFSWAVFNRYARGEVDANGQPIKSAERKPTGLAPHQTEEAHHG